MCAFNSARDHSCFEWVKNVIHQKMLWYLIVNSFEAYLRRLKISFSSPQPHPNLYRLYNKPYIIQAIFHIDFVMTLEVATLLNDSPSRKIAWIVYKEYDPKFIMTWKFLVKFRNFDVPKLGLELLYSSLMTLKILTFELALLFR